MLIVTPDYYDDFVCIADKCRHSCCVGWEIDIDDESYEFYKTVGGDFGKRLLNNIKREDNVNSFVLDKNERCPFLNDRGLCDIIINCGEDALCDICADHPRFRNFFDSRTEIGLGLCCEAATELILSQKDKTKLIFEGTADEEIKEEKEFFEFRGRIFDALQDRKVPLHIRIENMLSLANTNYEAKSGEEYYRIFMGLERLENDWEEYLKKLKNFDFNDIKRLLDGEYQTVFENLAVYFVFRHFAEGFLNDSLEKAAQFVAESIYVIAGICVELEKENKELKFSDIAEICRRYSSEIEYSDENIEMLMK